VLQITGNVTEVTGDRSAALGSEAQRQSDGRQEGPALETDRGHVGDLVGPVVGVPQGRAEREVEDAPTGLHHAVDPEGGEALLRLGDHLGPLHRSVHLDIAHRREGVVHLGESHPHSASEIGVEALRAPVLHAEGQRHQQVLALEVHAQRRSGLPGDLEGLGHVAQAQSARPLAAPAVEELPAQVAALAAGHVAAAQLEAGSDPDAHRDVQRRTRHVQLRRDQSALQLAKIAAIQPGEVALGLVQDIEVGTDACGRKRRHLVGLDLEGAGLRHAPVPQDAARRTATGQQGKERENRNESHQARLAVQGEHRRKLARANP